MKKGDLRRQAILDTAEALFFQRGYDTSPRAESQGAERDKARDRKIPPQRQAAAPPSPDRGSSRRTFAVFRRLCR